MKISSHFYRIVATAVGLTLVVTACSSQVVPVLTPAPTPVPTAIPSELPPDAQNAVPPPPPALPTTAPPKPTVPTEIVVYAHGMAEGWQTSTFSSITPDFILPDGNKVIKIEFDKAKAGEAYLIASAALPGSEVAAVSFKIRRAAANTPAFAVNVSARPTEYRDGPDYGANPINLSSDFSATRQISVSVDSQIRSIRFAVPQVAGRADNRIMYVDDVKITLRPHSATTGVTIEVQDSAAAPAISPRLFGFNLPNYAASEFGDYANMSDPNGLAMRAKQLGIKLLRTPGGAKESNNYGWVNCILGTPAGAAFNIQPKRRHTGNCGPGDAKAWDIVRFAQFLRPDPEASTPELMWVTNPYTLLEETVALVAFLNGADESASVGDVPISSIVQATLKAQGVAPSAYAVAEDWGNVSDWVRLRKSADFGNIQSPAKVRLWDYGNELYNASQHPYTCAGVDTAPMPQTYANGNVKCLPQFPGYKLTRDVISRTMQHLIDHSGAISIGIASPSEIQVGAVGTSPNSGLDDTWGFNGARGWKEIMLQQIVPAPSIYTIHHYPYYSTRPIISSADSQDLDPWLMVPHTEWGYYKNQLKGQIVGVTEYNSFEFPNDPTRLMTKMKNALYMADTFGQLVKHDYQLAAQWDLASGYLPQANNVVSQYGPLAFSFEKRNVNIANGIARDDNNALCHVYDADSSAANSPHDITCYLRDGNGQRLAARSPLYYVHLLWGKFGNQRLDVTTLNDANTPISAARQLAVYSGKQVADGQTEYTALVINKTGSTIRSNMRIKLGNNVINPSEVYADQLAQTGANESAFTFNGVAGVNYGPATPWLDDPSIGITVTSLEGLVVNDINNTLQDFPSAVKHTADAFEFPAYSVTLLRMRP